jgi:hypothetical protein
MDAAMVSVVAPAEPIIKPRIQRTTRPHKTPDAGAGLDGWLLVDAVLVGKLIPLS